MQQQLHDLVSVKLFFDQRGQVRLEKVFWAGREYPILKIGLHHQYRQGRTLFHVFSAVSESLFFRLVLNTDSLFWTLEEVSDGLPN
jgi:hypothetical protein